MAFELIDRKIKREVSEEALAKAAEKRAKATKKRLAKAGDLTFHMRKSNGGSPLFIMNPLAMEKLDVVSKENGIKFAVDNGTPYLAVLSVENADALKGGRGETKANTFAYTQILEALQEKGWIPTEPEIGTKVEFDLVPHTDPTEAERLGVKAFWEIKQHVNPTEESDSQEVTSQIEAEVEENEFS